MPYADKNKNIECIRRWLKTPEGINSRKKVLYKYNSSIKGKASALKYKLSKKYYDRIHSLENKEKEKFYRNSEKRKNYTMHWNRTPRGKECFKANKQRILSLWKEIFKDSNCEVCNKVLIFRSNDKNTSMHFDHRMNGLEIIKKSPGAWLGSHPPNDKNLAIWNSCNFGKLCHRCNASLPTLNRKEWLIKVIEYVNNT